MKKKLVQNLYDEDLYAMAHACLNGKCTQYCDPARKECKNCRYFVHKYTDDEKKVFYNYTLAFSHYENENERIRRKNEYIKRKDQRCIIDLLATVVVSLLIYKGWLTLTYGSSIL